MSKRMERADAQIAKAITNIIRDMNDPRLKKVEITITSTKTAPDFTYCKVAVSILSPSKAEGKEAFLALNKSSGFIRKCLCESLNMPNAPTLKFVQDFGFEHANVIEKILSNLEIPPIEEDND